MPTITFTYDSGGQVNRTLTLQKWNIRRRSVRVRYPYLNGGNDSHYRSTQLLFELQWEHLLESEYGDLVDIVNRIRQGTDVSITAVAGLDYFDDTALGSGLLVDLESDEVPESAGKYFENMPMEIAFITRVKRGLTNIT